MAYHLKPRPEIIKSLMAGQLKGPITMLNLLKYREIADYGSSPDLAPEQEVSGTDAYKLYMQNTSKYLQKVGGEVIFLGKSSEFLIGPETEKWDTVLIVKYPSVNNFLEMISDEGYLSGTGHRKAALEDSRLLPMEAVKGF